MATLTQEFRKSMAVFEKVVRMKGRLICMSSMYNILIPTLFGRGCIKELGIKAKDFGATKVLLIYDPTMPEDLIEKVDKSLANAEIKVIHFSNAQPNLPDYTIKEACDLVNASDGVDCIVGFGGGSAMDTAKCVNLMLNNPWPLNQYYTANGGAEVKNTGYPLILVPTTAGTGAEMTVAAVVTDTELDLKRPLSYVKCCKADLAIIDPELTLTMPAGLTAITGYDAFSHAFESYVSDDGFMTPATDAVCLAAMKTIVKYLPLVLSDMGNIEYREEMAYAANLAGIGIGNAHANKGHAISHAVGSLTHAPHAVCVACNLPFIAEKLTPAYYRRIRNVVKEVFGKEVDDNISADELGKLINGCIRQFELDIKCPSIKAYGATRQQIMDSAPLIMSDKLFHTGRVSMSREELEQVLTDVCNYYGLN